MMRSDGARTTTEAQSIMDALRRTVLALRMWAQEAEGTLGISGAQLFVLQHLAEQPADSLSDLAHRTLTSKPAVSVVVSRLVDRGLVSRRPSAADRRSVILALTPAGERIWQRAPESPQQRVLGALGRLPRRDLAAFTRLFAQFVKELGISTLEPRMLFDGDVKDRQPSSPQHRTAKGIHR